MLKKILTMAMLALTCTTMLAQKPADMQKAITQATQQLQSMQCDFVQTKHLKMLKDKMVSTGTMHYQRADKLRWEYQKPYKYTFIMNGQKVMITKGGRTDVINTAENKMFREVARIMMSTMTGSTIAQSKDFQANYAVKGSIWQVTLTPLRKDMKRIYSSIVLEYTPAQKAITRITLSEKSGNSTDILMKNIKTNASIPQSVFAVK